MVVDVMIGQSKRRGEEGKGEERDDGGKKERRERRRRREGGEGKGRGGLTFFGTKIKKKNLSLKNTT